jgi:hypothetical protein
VSQRIAELAYTPAAKARVKDELPPLHVTSPQCGNRLYRIAQGRREAKAKLGQLAGFRKTQISLGYRSGKSEGQYLGV